MAFQVLLSRFGGWEKMPADGEATKLQASGMKRADLTVAAPSGVSSAHARSLLILWAVALAPRLLAIALTVAPAKDAFRYYVAAHTLGTQSFVEAIRSIDAHPLYPITYLGAQRSWLWLTGYDGPYAWLRVGQAWSLVCYLAFITLAYFAGTRLWRQSAALLGCLAVSMIPRQVFYSVDILSDNLHAALWMGSFYLLLEAWQRPLAMKFLGSGALAGLAYWTRPEAILLPLVFVSSLTATQLVSTWRWPWTTCLGAIFAYMTPLLLIAGVYVSMTGSLSPKHTARAMLGQATVAEVAATGATPVIVQGLETAAGGSLESSSATSSAQRALQAIANSWAGRALGSIGRLVYELGQETRVLLLLLAIAGLVVTARQVPLPGSLPMAFAFLGLLAMLALLHYKAGFLAGRYLMPMLPFVGMLAVTGARAALTLLVQLSRLPWEKAWSDRTLRRRRLAWGQGSLAVGCLLLCIPGWLQPLHENRRGHMEAARWLAERSQPGALVFDPSAFSCFFANRAFWLPVDTQSDPRQASYAVIDPTTLERASDAASQAIAKVARFGHLVERFPRKRHGHEAGVYLFALRPSPEQPRKGRQQ